MRLSIQGFRREDEGWRPRGAPLHFSTTSNRPKWSGAPRGRHPLLALLLLCALLVWPVVPAPDSVRLYASNATHEPSGVPPVGSLTSSGRWRGEQSDLLYIVSFSSARQPYGPLVVYRAFGTDLRRSLPVVVVPRSPLNLTPMLFPSPDGRSLALLNPLSTGYDSNLNGASLSVIPTAGRSTTVITLAQHVALSDPVIWSADGHALYYVTSENGQQRVEIHRVELAGHDVTLFRQAPGQGSIRLVGLDRSGALIVSLAQSGLPVAILRLSKNGGQSIGLLPRAILPGNILGVGSDGASLVYEQVAGSQPQAYRLAQIEFSTLMRKSQQKGRRTPAGGLSTPTLPPLSIQGGEMGGCDECQVTTVAPLFDTGRYGYNLSPLARSADRAILVMSQVVSARVDLAAQGIPNVPAQERLVLVDARNNARQSLQLPGGGQLLQAFWAAKADPSRAQPATQRSAMLPGRQRASNGPQRNATIYLQDEWMLEGHANRLFDGPALPRMCYGLCASPNGTPHVSAAILHGVAYTESDWHQFNSSDFRVNGEAVGSPVESFDGGWGEYQQTWGMPPQCKTANNCRSDAFRVEHDQSYNIGVGIQSLINAWNNTAGVASKSDPNDPFKANDWFFAVWAYNGAYGNNPNDVPSSQYGHWYPGAPFNSIYEERVWFFAAHAQYASTGWTDNYIPSLGPALLPPQADFTSTSDSFVFCVTCTIPDWTPGSYDRDWVGYGAPYAQMANSFAAAFAQPGGENVVGLPRDNGGGAAVHRWGNGWTQDFGGGSEPPGALMLASNTTQPYQIYGSLWIQYLVADHGASGCHGYPTSNLIPYADPGLGSDTYLRQNFQQGYMVWDATISAIVADDCTITTGG